MNRTNIKQALRYLFKQRKYSIIIVLGLSVGMAASFLIYSYVYYEKSFDSFYQQGDRLYRVVVTNQDGLNPYKSPYSYSPQGPVGLAEVPEIENYVRLMAGPNIVISSSQDEENSTSFIEDDYYYADSSFFNLFSFPLIYGDSKTVLKEPGSVVISLSTATKLFGVDNPVGREIKVDGENIWTITGVFKDIPGNSHLKFNTLISLNTVSWLMGPYAWDNHSFFTYFLLKEGADANEVESKITSAFLKENRAVNQSDCVWKLQPAKDAYLKTTDFTSKPEAFKFGDNRIVYFKTYEMQIASGREFNETDNSAIILNENAVRLMGLKVALDNRINAFGNPTPIIGVVKNFHHEPLNINLDPIIIILSNNPGLNYMTVRLSGSNIKESIGFMNKKWNEISGNIPFEYHFLDERLRSAYNAEMKAGKVFSAFSILSIIIACMGILSIASFLIQRRIKEIGIRKAIGARTDEVTLMFLKDFVKWVIVAYVIACPLAWLAMNKWLQNFSYKTNLSWWVFIFAGIIAFGIAILTIFWQSWQAARRNPVEALRYE